MGSARKSWAWMMAATGWRGSPTHQALQVREVRRWWVMTVSGESPSDAARRGISCGSRAWTGWRAWVLVTICPSGSWRRGAVGARSLLQSSHVLTGGVRTSVYVRDRIVILSSAERHVGD